MKGGWGEEKERMSCSLLQFIFDTRFISPLLQYCFPSLCCKFSLKVPSRLILNRTLCSYWRGLKPIFMQCYFFKNKIKWFSKRLVSWRWSCSYSPHQIKGHTCLAWCFSPQRWYWVLPVICVWPWTSSEAQMLPGCAYMPKPGSFYI